MAYSVLLVVYGSAASSVALLERSSRLAKSGGSIVKGNGFRAAASEWRPQSRSACVPFSSCARQWFHRCLARSFFSSYARSHPCCYAACPILLALRMGFDALQPVCTRHALRKMGNLSMVISGSWGNAVSSLRKTRRTCMGGAGCAFFSSCVCAKIKNGMLELWLLPIAPTRVSCIVERLYVIRAALRLALGAIPTAASCCVVSAIAAWQGRAARH